MAQGHAGSEQEEGEKSVNREKILFFRAALGANPVSRQVLEGSACFDAVVRIACFGIIHIAAGAFEFLHGISLHQV